MLRITQLNYCGRAPRVSRPLLLRCYYSCPIDLYHWHWYNKVIVTLDAQQLSYAIGVAKPLSIFVDSYGTGVKPDNELLDIVEANFDLRPGMIVK